MRCSRRNPSCCEKRRNSTSSIVNSIVIVKGEIVLLVLNSSDTDTLRIIRMMKRLSFSKNRSELKHVPKWHQIFLDKFLQEIYVIQRKWPVLQKNRIKFILFSNEDFQHNINQLFNLT